MLVRTTNRGCSPSKSMLPEKEEADSTRKKTGNETAVFPSRLLRQIWQSMWTIKQPQDCPNGVELLSCQSGPAPKAHIQPGLPGPFLEGSLEEFFKFLFFFFVSQLACSGNGRSWYFFSQFKATALSYVLVTSMRIEKALQMVKGAWKSGPKKKVEV